MDIKPIETYYNGYRFRSRLEARWAVFFDEMEVPYQYEPEGFEFPDGTKYLPDFYLPTWKLYVEIKSSGLDQKVCDKVEAMCEKFRDNSDTAIMLCYGDPFSPIYKYIYGWDYDIDLHKSSCVKLNALLFSGLNIADSNVIDDLALAIDYDKPFCNTKLKSDFKHYQNMEGAFDAAQNQNTDISFGSLEYSWQFAAKKARQARFEHGETPIKDEFLIKDMYGNSIRIKQAGRGYYNVYHDRRKVKEWITVNTDGIMLLVISLCSDNQVEDFKKWALRER